MLRSKTHFNQALERLLDFIAIQIQLTETQDAQARQHYAAIAKVLATCPKLHLYSPHIYPQGSQNLGTTTRPIGQLEFDLDAVCLLKDTDSDHPGLLYKLVWDRLRDHGTYRDRIERKPRCIRVNYAGDFHLDIVPAIPDRAKGGNFILVPELDAKLDLEHPENDEWKTSNPLDYATWINERSIVQSMLLEKYSRSQVDPLPEREHALGKPPLKRSIQLLKRWRDIAYFAKPKLSPPSIILTTLAGMYYEGDHSVNHSILRITESVAMWLKDAECTELTSPSNDDEYICEKWQKDSKSFADFIDSFIAFQETWVSLQRLKGTSLQKELARLFGESPVEFAFRKLSEYEVEVPRATGHLGVVPATAGMLAVSHPKQSILIPKNNFFGDVR